MNCKECGGKNVPLTWMEPLRSRMEKNELCFDCQFWHDKMAIADDPNTARIAGQHYIIGPKRPGVPKAYCGFAGNPFCILFYDGRRVETTNLWHQGDIPERFKERLPNNARFLLCVCKKSGLSGKWNSMFLDITREQLEALDKPETPHIQHFLPHLTADEREFLISGSMPDEWDAAFKEEGTDDAP